MIALYILLGILLLIALLLFFPLRIHAKYDESLALEIRYLFVKLGFPRPPLTPEQEAKKAEKKAKKERKKEKKKAKKAEKKKKGRTVISFRIRRRNSILRKSSNATAFPVF